MTSDDTQMIRARQHTFDEAALLRLLGLAGPTDAPELMRRLRADLRVLLAGLTAGFAAEDRSELRRHSHDLLAIAGTIGARHLHHLAQVLNLCARDDACVLAAPDAADLLRRLKVLIDRLQDMAVELGLVP